MADAPDRTATPEDDPLAWEAENAPRAAISALAAAILYLAGSLALYVIEHTGPPTASKVLTLVDTLGDAAAGRPAPPGAAATIFEYRGEHWVVAIVAAIVAGLGTLAMYPPLAYLYRATAARIRLPRFALIAAAVGTVASGIGLTVSRIANYADAHAFVDSADHTNSAVAEAQSNPVFLIGGVLGQILGALALAVAFLLISLNARRAGLLRQLMGVIGMFVGATVVFGSLDPFGIVRSLWLAALGLLFVGRLPFPRPQAWSVPEAVPWPSAAQVREQREAARRARTGEPERPPRRRGAAAPAGNGDEAADARASRVPAPRAPQPRRPDAGPGKPHPSSKKRKRKRRSQ
jgi:MFS family permease